MSNNKCFVIMPYGIRKDRGGKINLDDVYARIIVPAVTKLKLECIRSDKIKRAGMIHDEMIEHIYFDDVAVVDITTLNPNVFWELGVRHATRDCVTVLIRHQGTKPPFNIQDMKVFTYDHKTEKGREKARNDISEAIRNGLSTRKVDSLPRQLIERWTGRGKAIPEQRIYPYKLKRSKTGQEIRIITGGIDRIRNVQVWVNSENTDMQMARFNDRSISSTIRYLGAIKDRVNRVLEDSIAKDLLAMVGPSGSVPMGEIVVTSAGELERTHGVKKIFHAAAVTGQRGHGYFPIPNVETCVTNALCLVDSTYRDEKFTSILFPLLGTGTAQAPLRVSVQKLLETAISYLVSFSSVLEHIYFICWTEQELDACLSVLNSNKECQRSRPEVVASQ